ncbi:MAG: ABC transporter substrate-binding protein [bacterium]
MIRLYAVLISFILVFSPVACAKEMYCVGFLGNTNNAVSNAMFNSLKFSLDEFNLTNTAYAVTPEFFNENDSFVCDSIKNKENLLCVIGLFGPANKNVIEAVTEIPLIAASSENLYFNIEGRQNLFRIAASEAQLAADTCRFLISVSLKGKLAIVYSTDSDEYQKMAQAYKNAADKNNTWAQYFKEVEGDRMDFTAVLLRLRDLKVHNIYFAGRAAQAAALARQSAEMNVGADFSSTHLICSSIFIKNAKAGAQGAIFSSISPSSLYGFKKFRPHLKKFGETFGGDDTHIPYVYDATGFLLNALMAGKINKNDIIKYLKDETYAGVTGNISFKENGDRSNPPVYFYIIRNKEFLQRSLMGSEKDAFVKMK